MESDMKILVIFTGGTIGSTVKDGYIGTDRCWKYKLLNGYSGDASVHFDTIEPYTILSENLDGEYLNKLILTIKHSLDKYDGIIITHGTDTLQYTAAGLSLLFSSISIPVVLVSSNYILEDSRANGYVNFHSAVTFIKQANTPGIFISYNNCEDNTYIHNGLLAMPHSPYDDKIVSCENNFYGFVRDNLYHQNKAFNPEPIDSIMSKFSMLSANSGAIKNMIHKDAEGAYLSHHAPVLYIKACPGQVYPVPPEHIKSVLIETYHSGTLCTEDKALSQFMELCRDKKISVFLTGVEDRITYESTKLYKELGVNILPKASPIAMYMLLWIAYC
ncbi:MAG: asparaginase domain-containing protein [Wujia sp.]